MNMYIGNLAREVTDEDLRGAFEAYGEVASAKVIKDNFSGLSRGFGFVEMPNNAEADTAMKALNGQELKGSTLKISEARPKSDKRRGGKGGNRRGGGQYW
ncbi:MAG: RNA-binding protein [Calditrichaceae bacterium]|nr:RNA-binding protein [Calditrichia bacterium]NUQ42075.1 RNA-binding protein [Calditrichaceae bacterium]